MDAVAAGKRRGVPGQLSAAGPHPQWGGRIPNPRCHPASAIRCRALQLICDLGQECRLEVDVGADPVIWRRLLVYLHVVAGLPRRDRCAQAVCALGAADASSGLSARMTWKQWTVRKPRNRDWSALRRAWRYNSSGRPPYDFIHGVLLSRCSLADWKWTQRRSVSSSRIGIPSSWHSEAERLALVVSRQTSLPRCAQSWQIPKYRCAPLTATVASCVYRKPHRASSGEGIG